QRAYWDEMPDQYLIERHEREIFPLAHKRYLFAGVEHFLLYDFSTTDGAVADDVFAYSNGSGDERALVMYHNTYTSVRGWVRSSAAFAVKTGSGDARTLVQRNLGEGLALQAGADMFCIFRDQVTGLEYIRASNELIEQGLYIELGAYKCHVFLDFRQVRDDPMDQYSQITGFLAGRGVPSIEQALKEIFLQPIHYPFKELVNADLFRRLRAAVAGGGRNTEDRGRTATDDASTDDELTELAALEDAPDEDLLEDATLAGAATNNRQPTTDNQPLLDEVEQKMLPLLREIKQFTESAGDEAPIAREVRDELEAILQLPVLDRRVALDQAAIAEVQAGLTANDNIWNCLFGWVFIHALGKITGSADFAEQSRSWMDEWLLGRIVAGTLCELGDDQQQAALSVMVIKRMTSHQSWFETPELEHAYQLLEALLSDAEVQQILRVNRYQDVLWFDKHAFERLLWWMLAVAVVSISAGDRMATIDAVGTIGAAYRTIAQLRAAAEASGYQVEKLLAIAHE
ncbi:MAG: alpha-amylase, partial [Roseiflexaceae bacterium]